ncbi:Myelin proteolipid protein PLP [Aphelenchoides avenae]|nr:Myelin proteolipid protein PLP [Aphelenchus avenae]
MGKLPDRVPVRQDSLEFPPLKDGFLARVPYFSVMAFAMCCIGVVMFSIMMVWSFNATVEQARRALNITDIPWLDKVQLAFIIIAVVMVGLAVVQLCVGALSTGSTREEVYKRLDARQGGRIMCVVAIALAYVLNILWMLAFATTAVFSFVYYIFSELCSSLTSYGDSNCLDFSVFRPLVKDFSDASLVLCGGSVQQFCALTNTVVTWYVVGFIGSMIICLGLIQFMASNAANYSHLRSQNRYIELKELIIAETAADPVPAVHKRHSSGQNGTLRKQYPPPIVGGGPAPPTSYPYPAYPRPHPPMRQGSHGFAGAGGTQRARRNSYHNSMHGSSYWLDQY